MKLITTTRGPVDETLLARTLGFEERPNEFVVWIEYRIDTELVRRDAHVILKHYVDGAEAVVGALGQSRAAELIGNAATGGVGGF